MDGTTRNWLNRRLLRPLIACAVVMPAAPAGAVDISVVGLFGNKAVVVVDGASPRTVTAGAMLSEGVRVVSVERDGAIFDIDGKRRRVAFGQTQYSSRPASRPSVVLAADERGHFFADGQINGQPIRFVVDTGATLVALSSLDAKRIGINYLAGEETLLGTANGTARAWRVRLDTARIGDITLNQVDAVVLDNPSMPALLGMSFLNRTEMRHEGALMTLIKRY